MHSEIEGRVIEAIVALFAAGCRAQADFCRSCRNDCRGGRSRIDRRRH